MAVAAADPRVDRKPSGRTAPRIGSWPRTTWPQRPLELDTAASRWQRAFDATDHALAAAGGLVPTTELQAERRALREERQQTATMLARLARLEDIRPGPWLSPVPVSRKMLGLPPTVRACLFDLDGVLTDSGVLHARAWADTFDGFLLRLSERAGWQFVPFDRAADYRAYIDGRPRLEGVHAFLNSRGIHLPEGRPDDPAGAPTAFGLARQKSETLAHGLSQRGVNTIGGARRYLEAAGFAGLTRGVVSASTRTLPMLELAGLATLIEERVDADVIRVQGLRSRPAPDLLLAACSRVLVRPEETVTFTNSLAGVAAGHAAGLVVIGVGDGQQAELLRRFGAEPVVASLSSLLDRRLTA
jgi:beta-phosphoglucomutase-like phosphatase (HAD superfamily)